MTLVFRERSVQTVGSSADRADPEVAVGVSISTEYGLRGFAPTLATIGLVACGLDTAGTLTTNDVDGSSGTGGGLAGAGGVAGSAGSGGARSAGGAAAIGGAGASAGSAGTGVPDAGGEAGAGGAGGSAGDAGAGGTGGNACAPVQNPLPIPCPEVCTGGCGPSGDVCTILCDEHDECKQAPTKTKCPAELACNVVCTGEGSCENVLIACPPIHDHEPPLAVEVDRLPREPVYADERREVGLDRSQLNA